MSGFVLRLDASGHAAGGEAGLQGVVARPGEYMVWDVERAWRSYLTLAMEGA